MLPSISLVLLPPSSWNVLLSTTVPATLPSGLIPGCNVRNVVLSRCTLGSESSERPDTVLPMVAFMVCTSTPVVCTSTVVLCEPTCSDTLRTKGLPTCRTRLGRNTRTKPVLVSVMSYLLGGRSTNTYRPASLVIAVCCSLVAVSVKVAVTPGTTAPLGSVTTPLTAPINEVCAHIGVTPMTKINAQSIAVLHKYDQNPPRLVILPPSDSCLRLSLVERHGWLAKSEKNGYLTGITIPV